MQPQLLQMPAEIRLLDDGGLEAELRGPDRGDVAARPRADDDNVERGISHAALPSLPPDAR